MRVFDLLNDITNEIEDGRKSIFASRKSIEVDYVLTILDEIRAALPRDLERAQKILDQREKIIRDARELASDIVEEAHQSVEQDVLNQKVLRLAQEQSKQIIDDAQRRSYELRVAADDYALSVLDDLTSYISEYTSIIEENKSNFLNKKKHRETLE